MQLDVLEKKLVISLTFQFSDACINLSVRHFAACAHLIADEDECQGGSDSLGREEREQLQVGCVVPLILPNVQHQGCHFVRVQIKVANEGLDLQQLQSKPA